MSTVQVVPNNEPAVTVAEFRAAVPAFADTNKFPDAVISFWITVAGNMLPPNVWGNMLVAATDMFVAHNVVLDALAQGAVDVGGLPGLSKGLIASEGVGAVSLSYDTTTGAEVGGGFWNQTTYGQRLYRWITIFGAGGFQIGTPGCNPLGPLNGPAWPGMGVGYIDGAGSAIY